MAVERDPLYLYCIWLSALIVIGVLAAFALGSVVVCRDVEGGRHCEWLIANDARPLKATEP